MNSFKSRKKWKKSPYSVDVQRHYGWIPRSWGGRSKCTKIIYRKINFYKIDPTVDSGIQKTADAIEQAVLAVNQAVIELRNLKNTQKIVECVIKINSIENSADDLFDLSIEKLFCSTTVRAKSSSINSYHKSFIYINQ